MARIRRNHKTSTTELLEMFRNNIVEVDTKEEWAVMTRNGLTAVAIATISGAFANVIIAVMLFSQ